MSNVFAEFLVNNGLYDEIAITKDNISELIDCIGGNVKIDVFCPYCKMIRSFSMKPVSIREIYQDGEIYQNELAEQLMLVQNRKRMALTPDPGRSVDVEWDWTENTLQDFTRVIVFPFVCSKEDDHRIDYVVRNDNKTMRKIGQYPSTADLSFPELEKYKNVISAEDRSELRKAIGLNAHGIGAGSYVYLRRIFERILDEAKKKAIEDGRINEDSYKNAHIEDRIKMLNGYIPEFICNNKQLYGIVSKGIHELSEEECVKYFPVLKSSILLILKQWNEAKEEKELINEMQKSLNAINSNLK